jgi:hypothetical protein
VAPLAVEQPGAQGLDQRVVGLDIRDHVQEDFLPRGRLLGDKGLNLALDGQPFQLIALKEAHVNHQPNSL